MKLAGKRIAILAENMYQEMELWVPYYRLKEEGAEVKVVGAGGAKAFTSKHGYPVNVDVQAEQVKAVEFDAVVVPGGYAPDMMRRHPAMVALVREAAGEGRRGDLPRRLDARVRGRPERAQSDVVLLDQGRSRCGGGELGGPGGRCGRQPDHLAQARRPARLLPRDRRRAQQVLVDVGGRGR